MTRINKFLLSTSLLALFPTASFGASACVMSFNDNSSSDTINYSCDGAPATAIAGPGGDITSDANQSFGVVQLIRRGYQLVNCHAYKTDTSSGRECYFVKP